MIAVILNIPSPESEPTESQFYHPHALVAHSSTIIYTNIYISVATVV